MTRIREISLMMLASLLAGCGQKTAPEQEAATPALAAPAAAKQLSWGGVVGEKLIVSYVGCPTDGAGGKAEHCHMAPESQQVRTAALSGGPDTFTIVVQTEYGTVTCEGKVAGDNPLKLVGTCVVAETDLVGSPEHEFWATLDRHPDNQSDPWIELHFSHPGVPGGTKIHDGSAHVVKPSN